MNKTEIEKKKDIKKRLDELKMPKTGRKNKHLSSTSFGQENANPLSTPEQHKKCIGLVMNEKYKTKEEKTKVLSLFATHISKGKPDKSFVEEDVRVMNRMLKNIVKVCMKEGKDPYVEYPILREVEKAKRKRLDYWMTIGIVGTTGKLDGFNSKSWQFIMCNLFKGDWKLRHDVTSDDKALQGPILYHKYPTKDAIIIEDD